MVKIYKIAVLAVSLFALVGLSACGDNNHPSVSADQSRVQMPVGVTTTVTVTQDGGPAAFDPDLTWTVDDGAVASLSWNSGQLAILGRASGSTMAHATYYGQEVKVDIIVDPAALLGITPSSASITVPVGLDEPLLVDGALSDGSRSDETAQASWVIDDPSLITIANGQVTGVKVGVTLVHATVGSHTATIQVTVTDAVLVSLVVDPPQTTIPAGLTVGYVAAGRYSDNTLFNLTDQVTWTTDDPAIATMSGARATGVHAGTTQVHAKLGALTGSADLTVSTVSATGLVISPDTATIPITHTQQLGALLQLSDGTTSDVSSQVAWSSATPAIATVDASGVVRGVAAGVVQIRATFGTLHATAAVTVNNVQLLRIDVTPNPILLAAGTHRTAIATGVFSDGIARDLTSEAMWSSDHPEVATVAAGDIVGTGAGAAQISATASGLTGRTTVLVSAAQLVSITVTAPSLTMPVGTTMPLTATATYSDGSTQDVTNNALWASDQPLHIVVSNLLSHGVATAIGAGPATISASVGLVTGSLALNATSATLTRLELDPTALTLPTGTSRAVTATAVYSDGTSANVTSQVLWSSSSPLNASVSTLINPGVVLGLLPGSATITARLGQITASVPVVVTAALLVSLQVSPDSASLALGGQTQFTATATYSDDSHTDVTSQVLWSSSATSVVAVSNAQGSRGLATTQATGGATISATLGTASSSAQVTVTAASSAISGWSVKWTLASGQQVTQVWNGTLSTSGVSATVTNTSYNGALAPGTSTTFGFLANGTPSTPILTCTSP